jgi:hypothetical protein
VLLASVALRAAAARAWWLGELLSWRSVAGVMLMATGALLTIL